MICHYCGKPTRLVSGKVIYPHRPDLHEKLFYQCVPDAYVGCHKGTTNPLGIVAKSELRILKSRVHALFDPLWRGGTMRRSYAYQWLAEGLGIDAQSCHVGMFDEDRCRQAIEFLRSARVKTN